MSSTIDIHFCLVSTIHDYLTECLVCTYLICSSYLGLRILTQPENVVCKPGDNLEFTVETSSTAKSYQWNLNGKEISNEDRDYDGSNTKHLSICKCLPKHKGSYKCVITTELDTSLSSEIATLKIGMYVHVCVGEMTLIVT